MAQIIPFIAMADLPNRIREFRKARGWSQLQLANQLNISIAHVSDLETGKRQLTQKWLIAIARVFGIDPAELLPKGQSGSSLTQDELHLLSMYRRASNSERRAIERVAESLSAYSAESADEIGDFPSSLPHRGKAA